MKEGNYKAFVPELSSHLIFRRRWDGGFETTMRDKFWIVEYTLQSEPELLEQLEFVDKIGATPIDISKMYVVTDKVKHTYVMFSLSE